MSYLTVDRQIASTSGKNEGDHDIKDDLEVDNSRSVLLKIATLYAEQLMSDLVLEVGGVGYPAHRLILCASSEVFQVMLMNREWSEWRESRVVLQETRAAAAVFPLFLKYFYTGQIRISHHSVLPVLSLADKYNVKDLAALCLQYMCTHVAHAAQRGHLIAWMQYTMACNHRDVAQACQNFVKWNLEWVWSEGELAALEGDTLLQLLQHSDLVLHNEMSLYTFVERWVRRQRERLQLEDADWDALVAALFSHVRFPMMCERQLARLLLSPLTQRHKEFFMERMAIAISYHSGHTAAVREAAGGGDGAGRAQFTPRLYTEDTWGSVLEVDNFHALPSYHTRTFIFSSRSSIADGGSPDRLTEWTVDLYPKGVWFKKGLLITWTGNYDVPEAVLRTVRVALTCHCWAEGERGDALAHGVDEVRVKVGVLVWGVQRGVEHVARVVERVHRFTPHNSVLNIDDALDFDELNTPLYSPPSVPASAASPSPTPSASPSQTPSPSPGPSPSHKRCRCADSSAASEPRYLLGPNRDRLRIQIVIMPLTEYCHVTPSPPY